MHSSSPHSCYMPCPSHPPWLDHSLKPLKMSVEMSSLRTKVLISNIRSMKHYSDKTEENHEKCKSRCPKKNWNIGHSE
jgi:hypothetical protein